MGISTSTSQVDRTQLVRGGGESCLGLRIEILGHQGSGHPEDWLKLDVQWEFQDPKMEVLTVPYKAIFCWDISFNRPEHRPSIW